jgi:hypothetical protein
MSALTVSSQDRESMGSLTLHIFDFSSVTSADTFASGLGTSVVGYWVQPTTSVGTGSNPAGAVATNSSGTFTFSGILSSSALSLFVVARN